MQEKEKIILEFMKDKDYVPMKAKEMASILMVPKNEYNEFILILNKLENEYKIIKNRKNKYRLSEKQYLKGIYRKNQKGFGFVKIDTQEDEIFIAKENSLNSLNGDRVLIEILEEKTKQKSVKS